MNELVLRELELNVFNAGIYVGGEKLENFVGDGLLITTSVGSTAYNTSLRGAIVYNTLHTLQITPIAPINTKAYRSFLNPVILPEKMHIEIFPLKKTLLAVFDGENKKLKFLRMKEYNFISIVNEKILSD